MSVLKKTPASEIRIAKVRKGEMSGIDIRAFHENLPTKKGIVINDNHLADFSRMVNEITKEEK